MSDYLSGPAYHSFEIGEQGIRTWNRDLTVYITYLRKVQGEAPGEQKCCPKEVNAKASCYQETIFRDFCLQENPLCLVLPQLDLVK